MRRKFTDAERRLSAALLAVWEAADTRADDETIELVKTALSALNLPWVRI